MRPSRALRGTALFIGVLTVACSRGEDPEITAPTSVPTTIEANNSRAGELLQWPEADDSVLVEVLPAEGRGQFLEVDPSLGTIRFEVLSCRLTWPGRISWSLAFDPPDDLELPADLDLVLSTFAGDVGMGEVVRVRLSGKGTFNVDSVRSEANARPLDGREEQTRWSGLRWDALELSRQRCDLELRLEYPVDVVNNNQRVQLGGSRPRVNAAEGTVESLLGFVDAADAADPLLPLADLFLDPSWPDIDRLWIAPTMALDSISIEIEGTCLTVSSRYGDERAEEPTVAVEQHYRCPGAPPTGINDWDGRREQVLGIEDPVWDVFVIGPNELARQLIAALAVVPFDGVEPFEPEGFDTEATLDAWYEQNSQMVEIGRVPFRGGFASLAHDPANFEFGFLPVFALHGKGILADQGGSSTSCEAHVYWDTSGDHRAVLIMASDVVARADIAAPPTAEAYREFRARTNDYYRTAPRTEVDLQDGADGWRFAVIDSATWEGERVGFVGPDIRYFDADGAIVPCVQ